MKSDHEASGIAAWLYKWELVLVVAFCAAALASIPVALGRIGLSWDALNHHIYLGWTAEHPRFDRDYLAASYQAYTFPYLYWPVYRLAIGHAGGVTAGVVLALIQASAVPAVWLIARTCVPGRSAFDMGMRSMAVLLAFASGVVLSFFDSTANDLIAAIPLVWALALSLQPWDSARSKWLQPHRAIWLAGLLSGVSIAFKLSNGPLAVMLPLLWIFQGMGIRRRSVLVAQGIVLMGVGFVVVYGYWGSQLWAHFGNPIYPFYDTWFARMRELSGWSR